MSHIADIQTEDGITLHLNSTNGRVDLSASRAHPTEQGAVMALAVTTLTAVQLFKLANACEGAARSIGSEVPGDQSNDPKAFDELAGALYRADIAEQALADATKKGGKS